LFDVDDLGMASEVGDGIVADDLLDKARRAVANCPEFAITLTEVGS
jgi:ferredoxin